jgi:NAD(P)-dependent dehydrogenase (short-subunit alcohol dehydrogenase family)
MESFAGKLAVVTGGGTGMGRELVVQLAEAGAHVATCDIQVNLLDETKARAEAVAPPGTRITTHRCDVSDRASMEAFAAEVLEQHGTDHVNLVFNNAGIAGGGSFVTGSEEEWERCFGVCWGGVYNGCRAFVPLLVKSEEGHLVNTSSVNGFWAALGPGIAHTAYSSAKFAVKGFSEALLEDFRLNAPHVKVSVVMPGHIGTDIIANTQRIQAGDGKGLGDLRANLEKQGVLPPGTTDEQLASMMEMMSSSFRDNAPLSAAGAATIILDAVKRGEWRILVGEDARLLDEAVRRDPLSVYGPEGLSLQGIVGAVTGE